MLTLIINENEGDTNIADSSGWTALHHACKNGHEDSIKTLIDMGANISSKSSLGLTPLHIACLNNNYHVISYLIERNANIEVLMANSGC